MAQTLEALHALQQANPGRWRAFKFKIQKRGVHDQNRKDKLSKYNGPDQLTCRTLASNARDWIDRPCTFWSHSQRSVNSGSGIHPSGQLVEFYINAMCDDA